MNHFTKINLDSNSTENFKPIGYAFSIPCGDGDFETDIEVDSAEKVYIDGLESTIIDYSHNGCNCNHCGARMKYIILVRNLESNSIHIVGRDCGDTIAQFGKYANRLSDKSALAMKIAKNKIERNKILSKYEGLKEAFEVKNNSIITNIRENFVKYNTISEKQVALVMKLATQQIEINNTAKAIDFTKLENTTLEVVSLKKQDSQYGEVTKILLKSDEGYKLYGNLPSSSDNVNSGDKVVFSCNNITISSGDKFFGFFSRAKIKKA